MAHNNSPRTSLNRRQVAQALGIPPEMATRNGIPSRMSAAEVAALDANPPAWLAQSRANFTGKRPLPPVGAAASTTASAAGSVESSIPKIPKPATPIYPLHTLGCGEVHMSQIRQKLHWPKAHRLNVQWLNAHSQNQGRNPQ